ncbi:MAG: hypothetical protein KUG82_12070 [Pseudomonadales bacterium]|nr:hypothetical protein [Pseudomonadales bacterium]
MKEDDLGLGSDSGQNQGQGQGQHQMQEHINQSLDESVHSLDAVTRSKLNQAREKAIAINSDQGRIFQMPGFALTSLAATAAVAVMWIVIPDTPEKIDVSQSLVELIDVELIDVEMTGEVVEGLFEEYWQEDPDFIDELEFVAWLVDDEAMMGEPLPENTALGEVHAG